MQVLNTDRDKLNAIYAVPSKLVYERLFFGKKNKLNIRGRETLAPVHLASQIIDGGISSC